jgi:hypothetical protein
LPICQLSECEFELELQISEKYQKKTLLFQPFEFELVLLFQISEKNPNPNPKGFIGFRV